MSDLILQHGLSFAELYHRDGLVRLDAAFIEHVKSADIGLFSRLVTARRAPDALSDKDESELLIELAPHLEDFVAALFGIGPQARALQERHDVLAPLYTVKRLFVQRRAAKSASPRKRKSSTVRRSRARSKRGSARG